MCISTVVYSLKERIEVIFIYEEEQRSARRTHVFVERHPDKNINETFLDKRIEGNGAIEYRPNAS